MKSFLLPLAIVSILTSSAQADWPMRRHDPHRTGRATGNWDITSPAPRWRYYLGGSLSQSQYFAQDVNQDGITEVVFVSGGRLIAKDPNLDSVVWETDPLEISSIAWVADLDGDGFKEIVVVANGRQHILILAAPTGAIRWQNPDNEDGSTFFGVIGAVRFVDVNGDGKKDLYAADVGCGAQGAHPNAMALYSFADGIESGKEICRLASRAPNYYCGQSDSLMDIDNDGEVEVVALGDITVHVYHTLPDADGVCHEKLQPLAISHLPYGQVQTDFADVDVDGRPEIFLATNNNYSQDINSRRVLMLDYDSPTQALVQRWEQSVADVSNDRHTFVSGSLSDLARDGHFEYTTSFYSFATSAWKLVVHDAQTGELLTQEAGYSLNGIADLNADGAPEILGYKSPDLTAFAYQDGALVKLWTSPNCRTVGALDPVRRLDRSASTATLMVDVEGDGIKELIALSGQTALLALDPATGARKFTYQVPDQTQILTWEPFANVTRPNLEQILSARSDGHLVVLGSSLQPTNEFCEGEFCQPGMRVGGYYSGSGGYGGVAVASDIDQDQAEELFIPDSRGVLLWVKPKSASWIEAPTVAWTLPGGAYPTLIQWDSDAPLELAVGVGSSIKVFDLDAASTPVNLWSKVIGPGVHLDPLPLDVDQDGALDLFVGISNPSGGFGQHNVLRHADGEKLWDPDYQVVVAGTGFEFNAAVDLDGDQKPDALSEMRDSLYPLRGTDGTLIGGKPIPVRYGSPMVVDVDGDGQPEVLTSGALTNVAMFELSPAAASPLSMVWTEEEKEEGLPKQHLRYLAAVADCGDGVRLVYGRDRSPYLALRHALTGALLAEPVLVGGRVFASQDDAKASGLRPGFLGNVNVHVDRVDGSSIALVGSTDGYLYAVDPCTGSLSWAHNFRYPVGEAIFADTDGDGKSEVIVSVADGYLYELNLEVLPAPAHVFDSDCDQPATSVDQDVDEVEALDTLCAGWDPVAGATKYLYTVVTQSGLSIIGGGQQEWQETSASFVNVGRLPIQAGQRYFFVVMARNDQGTSVQAMSDGVTIVDVSGPSATVQISKPAIDLTIPFDQVTIEADFRDKAGLKSGQVILLNGAGETVKEFGSWNDLSIRHTSLFYWSGQGAADELVPPGIYTIRASAQDLLNRNADAEVQIEVKNGSPDGGTGQPDASGCGCGHRGKFGSELSILMAIVLSLGLRLRRRLRFPWRRWPTCS